MNIDFARKLELAYHQQCKDLCNEFHLKQTGFDILMFLGNNPQYKYAKDIVEIWRSSQSFIDIRNDIRMPKKLKCEKCEVYNECHGGCPVFNINCL